MDAPQDTPRTHPAADRLAWDPVYLHARREAAVILLLLGLCCAWSVAAGWYLGYETSDPAVGRAGDNPAAVNIILGMPAWVFWSVFLPWVAVDGIAIWFCFFYMQNDPLDEGETGKVGLGQAGADE